MIQRWRRWLLPSISEFEQCDVSDSSVNLTPVKDINIIIIITYIYILTELHAHSCQQSSHLGCASSDQDSKMFVQTIS